MLCILKSYILVGSWSYTMVTIAIAGFLIYRRLSLCLWRKYNIVAQLARKLLRKNCWINVLLIATNKFRKNIGNKNKQYRQDVFLAIRERDT